MWLYSPPKRPKPKVPDDVKAAITEQAEHLLAEWRPRHIKPPPPGYQFNYVVELYGTWFRSYFYLCAKYACPGPTALSPFFEARPQMSVAYCPGSVLSANRRPARSMS